MKIIDISKLIFMYQCVCIVSSVTAVILASFSVLLLERIYEGSQWAAASAPVCLETMSFLFSRSPLLYIAVAPKVVLGDPLPCTL